MFSRFMSKWKYARISSFRAFHSDFDVSENHESRVREESAEEDEKEKLEEAEDG